MDDEKWKPLRRKLNKGFQPENLKFMTRGINYSLRTFLNILYKKSLNGKFDIKPIIENAVFDTVAGSAFGVTMNSQIQESEFSLTVKSLMEVATDSKNAIGMIFLPSCFQSVIREFKQKLDSLVDMSKKIIIKRLIENEKNE